jgi:type IV secretory pathway VirD2 relaxase
VARGVADDGSDLVVSRMNYARALWTWSRPSLRPEHEIRSALAREVEAERWTHDDAAIRMAADDSGFIDMRPDDPGEGDPQASRLAPGQLQKLERMGLATAAGPDQSMIGPEAEPILRDLGMRATSSRPCTGPSPDAVRIVESPTT